MTSTRRWPRRSPLANSFHIFRGKQAGATAVGGEIFSYQNAWVKYTEKES